MSSRDHGVEHVQEVVLRPADVRAHTYSSPAKLAFAATLSGLLLACTSTDQTRTLKQTYDRTAQYHMPDRNPIIVIPGILGSRLVDDRSGTTVWGAFNMDFADPATPEGASLIALPLDASGSLDDATGVRSDGVLESLELNFLGFPIRVQAYAGLLATLGAGGYRDETLGLNSIDYGNDHFTCFQFDYDWRRDISHNAAALKEFIDEKRLQVQETYAERYGIVDADIKFDIAAHSMGSLVTRYFLRYGDQVLPEDGSLPVLDWSGASDVERAILVAPPNAGSIDALEQLVEGFNTGRPLLPHYDPEILGTFPSVYQLLPRTRHAPLLIDVDGDERVADVLDPGLWQRFGWGLAAKDEESRNTLRRILPDMPDDVSRQELAREFQSHALERAGVFHEAMDRPATPPPGLEIYLVAGDATPTRQQLRVYADTGELSLAEEGVGDGTVLRSSTLLDERLGSEWTPTLRTPIDFHSTLFLPAEHRAITDNPTFEDNVLFWLLELPRERLRSVSETARHDWEK